MAKLITAAEQYATPLCSCAFSVAEAAEKLGVSESTVRQQVRRLGVRRISGRTVAGFVAWPHPTRHGVTITLPYTR